MTAAPRTSKEPTMPDPAIPDPNRQLALAVVWRTRHMPAPDVRVLLDFLGLLDGTGRAVRPSPPRPPVHAQTADLATLGTAIPRGHVDHWLADDKRRPTRSTAPDGLRLYCPHGKGSEACRSCQAVLAAS